jgi:hypothetical protein
VAHFPQPAGDAPLNQDDSLDCSRRDSLANPGTCSAHPIFRYENFFFSVNGALASVVVAAVSFWYESLRGCDVDH